MDEDKLNVILESLTELKVEITHLNQRMESKSDDIKELKKDVAELKMQLALNDQKTNKMDKWATTVLSCVITILLGFIALKLGLK